MTEEGHKMNSSLAYKKNRNINVKLTLLYGIGSLITILNHRKD